MVTEVLVVFTMFFLLFLISYLFDDRESNIREVKTIYGFNEYETRLIKNFKDYIDEKERNYPVLDSKSTISFYIPTEMDTIDLDRVRMYINMNLKTQFLIENITVKYNKSHTKISWYVINFSRR